MIINRRQFIKTGAVGALSIPITGCKSLSSQSQSQAKALSSPNIVLFITDQHHANAFSCLGGKYVSTPNLDSIINGGVSFSNAYTTNPVCIPARSSLFTGRMPTETGNWFNSERSGQIESGIATLGSRLREQGGYESVYAGKWHVPKCHTFDIEGFDVLSAGQNHWGDVSDRMAAQACANYIYSRKDSQRPFFMVCSLIQPHDICMWLSINTANQQRLRYELPADQLPPLPENFNYDAREPEAVGNLRKSQQAFEGGWQELQWRYYLWNYYRHVEMADSEVGRVLDSLKSSGLMDNTLIIHLSDHGEGLGEHQMVRKGYLYDSSAKIPLSFYCPKMFDGGRRNDSLVSLVDIFPTLCDILGIECPPNMCGTSLYPLLKGQVNKLRRDRGDFIVVEEGANGKGLKNTARMVRSEKYKYIKYYADNTEQLFDMLTDRGEMVNLADDASRRSVVSEHRDMLKQWENGLQPAPRSIEAGVDKWRYL